MKRLLPFVLILLASFGAKATHNRAGEISIQFLGGLTVRATVTTYTVPDSPADRPFLEVGWGDGNIDVDPMFVDTANSNYHLLASSQLINGGHPDSTDSDGSRADMGAYPYLNSYSGPTWYITES